MYKATDQFHKLFRLSSSLQKFRNNSLHFWLKLILDPTSQFMSKIFAINYISAACYVFL